MKMKSSEIERELKRHLCGNGVAFFLGAGASYLNGRGYPLAGELAERILPRLQTRDRKKLKDTGGQDLESMLDQLPAKDFWNIRKPVIKAIRGLLAGNWRPSLHLHRRFLQTIKKRQEKSSEVYIFTTNYDTLLEDAAEAENIPLFDGFWGTNRAFFCPNYFSLVWGAPDTNSKGRPVVSRHKQRPIFLLKLHGSVNWWKEGNAIYRSPNSKRPHPRRDSLMIPPYHTKISDSGLDIFGEVRTKFFDLLGGRGGNIKRLVTIGYGFGDKHINSAIKDNVQKGKWVLIAMAKEPHRELLNMAQDNRGGIVVTQDAYWLKGQRNDLRTKLWDFQQIVKTMEEGS